jgi:hypothetical protein
MRAILFVVVVVLPASGCCCTAAAGLLSTCTNPPQAVAVAPHAQPVDVNVPTQAVAAQRY